MVGNISYLNNISSLMAQNNNWPMMVSSVCQTMATKVLTENAQDGWIVLLVANLMADADSQSLNSYSPLALTIALSRSAMQIFVRDMQTKIIRPSHAVNRRHDWGARQQPVWFNNDEIWLISYSTDTVDVELSDNVDHITSCHSCMAPIHSWKWLTLSSMEN